MTAVEALGTTPEPEEAREGESVGVGEWIDSTHICGNKHPVQPAGGAVPDEQEVCYSSAGSSVSDRIEVARQAFRGASFFFFGSRQPCILSGLSRHAVRPSSCLAASFFFF